MRKKIWLLLTAGLFSCVDDAVVDPAASSRAAGADEWYAFVGGRIALNTSADARPLYLSPPVDQKSVDDTDGHYKPVPSPDGSQIAYFRLLDGSGAAFTWKTQMWVMDADGSNHRQLTSGEFTDVNPMWTRDASNKIGWTRFQPPSGFVEPVLGFPFPMGANTFWTSPDASPGDEEQISMQGIEPLTFFEFAYSGLRDGRLFVRSEGFNNYYLMTPAPLNNGVTLYEPIVYPNPNTLLHKASISPSETLITYMKVADAGPVGVAQGPDPKSVIAYAQFDAASLSMSNEVEITSFNPDNRTWYPVWSADEQRIRYACSGDCPDPADPGLGQIYEYDLLSQDTRRISGDLGLEYRYPATKGIPR